MHPFALFPPDRPVIAPRGRAHLKTLPWEAFPGSFPGNSRAALNFAARIKCARYWPPVIRRYAWRMSDAKAPTAPKGSGPAARRLWRSVVTDYDLDQHELLLLTEACRTADLLDELTKALDGADLTTVNRHGEPVMNPVVVERRMQAITLARLLAAMRMPSGDEADRPQRRGGARGAYGVRRIA